MWNEEIKEQWEKMCMDATYIIDPGASNAVGVSKVLGRAMGVGLAIAESNTTETLLHHPAYAPARLILEQINHLMGWSGYGWRGLRGFEKDALICKEKEKPCRE